MLDTNIVSDMLRNPSGSSVKRGESVGQAALCVSVVTACELRFGALKKASERLSRRINDFLLEVPALPFDSAYDGEFAEIRWRLERRGTPIGPFDLLIAAHAKSLDLTLVTDNIREFSRVEGLKVENWLEETPHV
jgi:tRNA(fMet)-specific endonuclease VapC